MRKKEDKSGEEFHLLKEKYEDCKMKLEEQDKQLVQKDKELKGKDQETIEQNKRMSILEHRLVMSNKKFDEDNCKLNDALQKANENRMASRITKIMDLFFIEATLTP